LGPGEVFYDVGAHHGYLSLLGCVLVGPKGHVYSFEPLPPNASILQAMITCNRITHHTLAPVAVSNVKGFAKLFLGDGNEYRASLFQWKGGNRLEVETLTLDEFVKTHRPPTLVKVDVEGAELLVLEGAADLLTGTHAPSWVIEVHSEQLDKAVNEVLTRHSYRIRYTDIPSSVRHRPYPRHLIAERL
jgi:FkbM family methyltransferase